MNTTKIRMVADQIEGLSEGLTAAYIGKEVYWVSDEEVGGPFSRRERIDNTDGYVFIDEKYESALLTIQIMRDDGYALTNTMDIKLSGATIKPTYGQSLMLESALDKLKYENTELARVNDPMKLGASYTKESIGNGNSKNTLFVLTGKLEGIQDSITLEWKVHMAYIDIVPRGANVFRLRSAETGMFTFVNEDWHRLTSGWYYVALYLETLGVFEVETSNTDREHKELIYADGETEVVLASGYRYTNALDKRYMQIKRMDGTSDIAVPKELKVIEVGATEITKCDEGKFICVKDNRLVYVVKDRVIDSMDCDGMAEVKYEAGNRQVKFGKIEITYNSKYDIIKLQ